MDWIHLAQDVYWYHFVKTEINEDCCLLGREATQHYITQNIKSHMIMNLNCHRQKRSSWMSHYQLLKHLAWCYPLCQTCERLGLNQIRIRKKITDRVSGINNGQCKMRSAHCIHYYYAGLFEMIVRVLTTCHAQYTWDRSICIFLFNRTTPHVYVTYLIGALYVHPLWFYKYQHGNWVRSRLSVACQRWWFQWRFWFLPSVPGYLQEEEEHKHDPWRNPIERNHMGLPLKPLPLTCYRQFGMNSIIMLMFVESQRVHI